MENFPSDWDLENLVKELSQGRELAKQLQIHLNDVQSSNYSHENREFLLHQILNSYDHALSMLEHTRPGAGAGAGAGAGGEAAPPGITAAVVAASESPRGSPRSDDSDQDSSRKRKAVPRWTEKVKVCPETGIEGQLADGYGWRKYGQKDILGAKYPRGYYRCTHRHGQGCLATKQVQRSDDDPTIFEITYRRNHTCNTHANSGNNNNPPIPMPNPQNEDPNPLPENPNPLVSGTQQNQQNEPLFNIQTSLRVITQDLGTNENPSFEPFDIPSSSTINPENNHIFSDSNDFLENNYSPNLLSPRSNYLPILPNVMNNNYEGLVYTSESELSTIVAAMTSTTNSSTLDINFPFGPSEFGSNFGFGNPGYFP